MKSRKKNRQHNNDNNENSSISKQTQQQADDITVDNLMKKRIKVSVWDVAKDKRNEKTIKKLILFTILMLVIPVGVLLLARNVAPMFFEIDSTSADIYGGTGAVISTLMIMIIYVVLAFAEDQE